jgi:hypothetical protein
LFDVDSKIPNLALMKLSRYHKANGDDVTLTRDFDLGRYDLIYASIIFRKNRSMGEAIRAYYHGTKVILGGTGWDLSIRLPEGIEHLIPDYDLYPGLQESIGFTTRGCIRKCYFCVVPEKEGRFHHEEWMHPRNWHDPRFENIQLLDNNWLADRSWFFETSEWIISRNLKLRENGLDIRLVDDEIAKQLSRIKLQNTLKFAFDSLEDEPAVLRGIEILKRNGVRVRDNVFFYVYVRDDSQYDSGVERCRKLKEWGSSPFVMFDPESEPTPRIRRLQRWANRIWIFHKIDIEEYTRRKI